MGLLTLLPILGLAFWLCEKLEVGRGTSLLYTVSLTMVVLYAGGLIGLLWWTALAIHVIGIGLLGQHLILASRGQRRLSIPIPYVFLAVLTVLFGLANEGSQYVYYDEYSHWGVYIREMLALDQFWGADTNALKPRSPPGAPLWQYLFGAFLEPSEGRTYVAQFVLLTAPLMVLVDRFRWSQIGWVAAVIVLAILALTNFGHGFRSLYVDHVLGTWFFGTIACFVFERPRSLGRVVPYGASLIVLALLKDAGLAFALSAAAIMASLYLIDRWEVSKVWRTTFVQSISAGAVLLIPVVLCLLLWEWNRQASGTAEHVQSVEGIVSGLVTGAMAGDSATAGEIARRFGDIVVHQQLSKSEVSVPLNEFSYPLMDLYTDPFRLSTLGFLIAFVIWWLVLLSVVLRGRDRAVWAIVSAGMLVTCVAYLAVLYMSYRFAFDDRGLELPSYIRYVHSITLPMLLVSFLPLLPGLSVPDGGRVWQIAKRKVRAGTVLFVSGLAGLLIFETPHLGPHFAAPPKIALRAQIEPITESIRNEVGRERLWLYLPQDQPNGFIGELLQFLLAPTPTSVERSPQFFSQADAVVAEEIHDFDYVWIPSPLEPDERERLDRLATGHTPDTRLFRVRHEPHDRILLDAVVD